MTTPWLTDAEVDDLCDPLVQPAAQIRYLRAEGLTVGVKPIRRSLVRAQVEEPEKPNEISHLAETLSGFFLGLLDSLLDSVQYPVVCATDLNSPGGPGSLPRHNRIGYFKIAQPRPAWRAGANEKTPATFPPRGL